MAKGQLSLSYLSRAYSTFNFLFDSFYPLDFCMQIHVCVSPLAFSSPWNRRSQVKLEYKNGEADNLIILAPSKNTIIRLWNSTMVARQVSELHLKPYNENQKEGKSQSFVQCGHSSVKAFYVIILILFSKNFWWGIETTVWATVNKELVLLELWFRESVGHVITTTDCKNYRHYRRW